ncbi:hypothetical protein FSP39_023010 [Pinctada imbricata]|uniref:Uncharacterized protein n=1 Tax=Pinctada imbricata TaxID=66713 RepID=A0AA88Y731_PINIB|nr:hypothetical protein FSP39_023010 [Pinctada imbricata]
MSSGAVTCGCLGMLVCLVLQVVGLATPYWYVLEYGLVSLNAGLFQLCLTDKCYTYISYGFSWSIDYIGLTGSQCLGALLLLIGLIVGLAGCSNQNQRAPVQNIAGLAIGASACLIAGIIWFIVRFYINYDTYFSLFSSILGIKLGYSFYLCAVSAGLTFVLAITMCIVGSNMQAPAVAPVAQQPGNALVVMNTQQQHSHTAYPNNYGPYPPNYGQPMQAAPSYAAPYGPEGSNPGPVVEPVKTGIP